jgi:hypothetical protein
MDCQEPAKANEQGRNCRRAIDKAFDVEGTPKVPRRAAGSGRRRVIARIADQRLVQHADRLGYSVFGFVELHKFTRSGLTRGAVGGGSIQRLGRLPHRGAAGGNYAQSQGLRISEAGLLRGLCLKLKTNQTLRARDWRSTL